mgnify:CR=1 FL=1
MTREEAIKIFEGWAQCNYAPTKEAAQMALSALRPVSREQVDIFGRKHNQMKKNFCDRCGQMIDWEGVEHDAGRSD